MTDDLIRTYYINLDDSMTRRASIEAQLTAAGISNSHRISAFDGRQISLCDMADYDDKSALRFLGRSVFNGEYGCYRSHLDALRQFLDSEYPYALILEDDALISTDISAALTEAISELDTLGKPWDLLHLSASNPLILTRNIKTLGGGYTLSRAFYFPITTTALLWQRSAAEQFLHDHAVVSMPVDIAVREMIVIGGRGYALSPPPVSNIGAPSDIDMNGDARKRQGRHWTYHLRKQQRLWKNKLRALYRKLTEPG